MDNNIIFGLCFLIIYIFIMLKIYQKKDKNKNEKITTNNWQANCTINNNTSYEMQLSGTGVSSIKISSKGYTSWSSNQVHNTISINIYALSMQGNLSFGPQAGVYIDRGWLPEDAQTIKMTAVANDDSFIQTTNGGEQLLQWNQFMQGGDITLTFDNQ